MHVGFWPYCYWCDTMWCDVMCDAGTCLLHHHHGHCHYHHLHPLAGPGRAGPAFISLWPLAGQCNLPTPLHVELINQAIPQSWKSDQANQRSIREARVGARSRVFLFKFEFWMQKVVVRGAGGGGRSTPEYESENELLLYKSYALYYWIFQEVLSTARN